jgi:hypothetical protein
VLVDPLSAPVPAAGGVVSVGLLPVPPPAGGVDGGDTVVGELLAGTGGVALGLADWDGWAELVWHCVPVAPAGCLPVVALLLDFADAVVLALAVELALAVPVAAVVAVPVVVVVALSPGLPPVLPLAGLLAELAGGALGVADLVDAAGWALAGDDEPVEHGATGALLWTVEVPGAPAPPPDAPARVAVAFRLGAGPLELGPVIPTAELSWPTAWRSGGTDRATPMANTTQAAASAGRSHPDRQSSRGCRWPAPAASCPLPAASCPPRAASQRRTRPARNPARKPLRAAECLLA